MRCFLFEKPAFNGLLKVIGIFSYYFVFKKKLWFSCLSIIWRYLYHLINPLFFVVKKLFWLFTFGSVVAHPDLDGEVSGSSPGHTKDLKNGTYCSKSWLSDKIKKGYKTYGPLTVSSLWHITDNVCPFKSYLIIILS